MSVAESLRIALDALRANRLRSALTVLGVVIGVMAVVVLVAIGSGAKRQVTHEVEGLGSNLVIVVPGRFQFGSAPSVSRFGLRDVAEVGRVLGDPRLVAATVASGEEVRVGRATTYSTVNGINENVPLVFDRPLERGRDIRAADLDTRRRVAVLGADVARTLFGPLDPVGRQVSIAGVRFRVVGLYKPVGSTFGVNRDSEVHVPLTAAQRLLGVDRVDALAVRAPSSSSISRVQREVLDTLRRRYPGEQFSAVTQTQILGTIGRVLSLLTLLLAAIAGISLLVGGVGVSNIMLVSVRERTREIGLRKALGARQRDVLRQFLLEAVALTALGGIAGIVLGTAIALAVQATTPLPAAQTWWSPVLSFAVSVAVGVVFGVAPARRAGRMPPAVALRAD